MGIHTGEVEARGGDFFGPVVNRTARIMSAGHGGQVLLGGYGRTRRGPSRAWNHARDLGERRLKDLASAARLFQLATPGLLAEFLPVDPRPPAKQPPDRNLGVRRPRRGACGRSEKRLDDADIRLVTLTGPGGSGKTRLAIRAAAEQIDRFSDGVYFVDLVTATGSDAVLALVATALDLADAASSRRSTNSARHLGQRVLLVLDNFEQVTVAPTRRAAPTVRR